MAKREVAHRSIRIQPRHLAMLQELAREELRTIAGEAGHIIETYYNARRNRAGQRAQTAGFRRAVDRDE